MNILIIGGTGFLSSRIAEKLLSRGHNLTLLVRGRTKTKFAGNKNLSFVYGDRNDKKILNELTSNSTFDVVYDMVAYSENDSQTAIDVFNNKIGRFIHCSTISVYMLAEEVRLPVTEDQINLPLMKEFRRSPFGWEYGINKIKCENVLWRNHNIRSFPVSMLRPTYISGPGDPAKRDYFWIERILDGKPLLVPGDGNFKFQEVFIEDAAEAFCKIIETNKSIGEAYNVAAEEVFTLNEYLEALMQLLDRNVERFYLDQEKFDKLDISYSNEGDVFTFNTRRHAVFSLDKIKDHLNYKTTPFNDYMSTTINWFLKNYDGHSCGYSRREEELNTIKSLKFNA
jgi:nucleoside-diphosphate-sugar epimerase